MDFYFCFSFFHISLSLHLQLLLLNPKYQHPQHPQVCTEYKSTV